MAKTKYQAGGKIPCGCKEEGEVKRINMQLAGNVITQQTNEASELNHNGGEKPAKDPR